MKRKIIKIDKEKCNGCGLCVNGCPEGALQIIDGKAKLVGELLCDGLGACIGTCPEDAIVIEEREAEEYSEEKVMENVVKEGEKVVAAHLKHLKEHGQEEYLNQAKEYLRKNNIEVPDIEIKEEKSICGCPGAMMADFRDKDQEEASSTSASQDLPSHLRQWPIQLQLLNPVAPYFQNADLVIAADCVPFSYANFHERFLKGKTLVILCPKLDQVGEMYTDKLGSIFQQNNIKSITILHMEVPCCFGVTRIVEEALKVSGKDIPVEDITISIAGEEKAG